MSEAVEHFFVEAFIPQLPIEAFDEAILLRFAGLDVGQDKALLCGPDCQGCADVFRAVIDPYRLRCVFGRGSRRRTPGCAQRQRSSLHRS